MRQLARGNHGNLATVQPVLTIEKLTYLLTTSCSQERVGRPKAQNTANLKQSIVNINYEQRLKTANNSDGACAMTITADQQSFPSNLGL